jgi:hypothetical protein
MRAIVLGATVAWLAAGALGAQASGSEPRVGCAAPGVDVRGAVERLGGGLLGPDVRVTIGWNVMLVRGMTVRTERCERTADDAADGQFRATGVPTATSLLLTATTGDGDVGVAIRHDVLPPPSGWLMVYVPA